MGSNIETLRTELDILRCLDHPNVIKLYSVYEDQKYIHIVTDLCKGGDMVDAIIARYGYSEEEAAQIMMKLLGAVKHMHSQNVVHRDIKPDNILLTTDGNDADYKIIDFGLSGFYEGKPMNALVGTPCYMAPEVITKKYGKESDIWSLGVILYVMLCGNLPFEEYDNYQLTFAGIIKGEFDLETGPWQQASETAKDLIRRMICVDVKKRITTEEALKHDFFDQFALPTLKPSVSMVTDLTKTLGKLRDAKCKARLQVEATKVALRFVNTENFERLKTVFQTMDADYSGQLSADELEEAFNKAGMPMAGDEIKQLMQKFDYFHKGHINYSDFLAAAVDLKGKLTDEVLHQTFVTFDSSNKGFITPEDLLRAFRNFGSNLSQEEIEKML